jgi:hypothetical protein
VTAGAREPDGASVVVGARERDGPSVAPGVPGLHAAATMQTASAPARRRLVRLTSSPLGACMQVEGADAEGLRIVTRSPSSSPNGAAFSVDVHVS